MDFYLLKTIILGVFIGNFLVYLFSIAVNKIREKAHNQQMKRELVTLRKMLQENILPFLLQRTVSSLTF